MELKCAQFENGKEIPVIHTCQGPNLAPSMFWVGELPTNTKSVAIICIDVDSPSKDFIHWIIYDIPVGFTKLPANLPNHPYFNNGTKQGINDFGKIGWTGPNPPEGLHRYVFTMIALDVFTLEVNEAPSKKEFDEAVKGHIIHTATLTGVYQKEN